MKLQDRKERGFLLITVLLILVLLMVMGVSFTGMALWGLDRARLQRDRTIATYLARGGVEYAASEGVPPRGPDGTRKIVFSRSDPPPAPSDSRYSCLFVKEGDLIYCTGVVEDPSGTVVSRKTLAVSLWSPEIIHEVSSPPEAGQR